jgi:hypothetical protein
MGTYLAIGIVQDIKIRKHTDIQLANIIDSLKKELNLDCYDLSEDEKTYIWKIKPKMLEGNFLEFLDLQLKMLNIKSREKTITHLKNLNNLDEILQYIKDDSDYTIRLDDNFIEYIKVIKNNNFDTTINVDYNLIIYSTEGKVETEGLNSSLRYFEQNIHLQNDKYPIADCVKILITA